MSEFKHGERVFGKPGDIVKINGITGDFEIQEALYNYDVDKVRCAICGGLGMPWGGWFSCEDDVHVAFIPTGESFRRI